MNESGKAWVFGDNIDTDVLAPGLYMKGPLKLLAAHCLEAVDPDFAPNVEVGRCDCWRREFWHWFVARAGGAGAAIPGGAHPDCKKLCRNLLSQRAEFFFLALSPSPVPKWTRLRLVISCPVTRSRVG